MPVPVAATVPFATAPTGGGGGGGLTGETDTLLMRDTGNGTYFLRHLERDDTGATTGSSDTLLDGTTAYVLVGTAVLSTDAAGLPTVGDPIIDRKVAADSPYSTPTGRRAVSYKIIANAGGEVSVMGSDAPVNTGHTFWDPRGLQPPIDFVITGAGEVEIIEEVA